MKQLYKENSMKESIDHSLKVEEVGIAWESVDPSDPHEQGVLQTVDEAQQENDLALHMLQQFPIQSQSKSLQV